MYSCTALLFSCKCYYLLDSNLLQLELTICFCSDSRTWGTNTIFTIWTFFYSCHSKEAIQFKIQFLDKERCLGWYLWEILSHTWYSTWRLSRFNLLLLLFFTQLNVFLVFITIYDFHSAQSLGNRPNHLWLVEITYPSWYTPLMGHAFC